MLLICFFKSQPACLTLGTCYNILDSSENVRKRRGLTEGLADNESDALLQLRFLCNSEVKILKEIIWRLVNLPGDKNVEEKNHFL